MKRQAMESEEQIDTEHAERDQKRLKEDEVREAENTGGAQSSDDHIRPAVSDDQCTEGAKNRFVPNVRGPSRKEREEHEETHCVYRSWCKHCVKGRGREDGHNRKTQEGEKTRYQQLQWIIVSWAEKIKSHSLSW